MYLNDIQDEAIEYNDFQIVVYLNNIQGEAIEYNDFQIAVNLNNIQGETIEYNDFQIAVYSNDIQGETIEYNDFQIAFWMNCVEYKNPPPKKNKKTGNARIKWHRGAFVRPLLRWKSHKYYILWVCVCSLRYPACSAPAPYYCHLWTFWLYHIFPHYLINDKIFRGKKKLLNLTCVLWFSLQILCETLILRRNERDISCTCIGLHVKCPLLLSDFNKT